MHEVMCPIDDAHLTLEFADHFVIQPAILFDLDFQKNASGEKGSQWTKDFQYSSDRNDHWLEGEQLAAMIRSTEIEMSGARAPRHNTSNGCVALAGD